MCVSVYMYVHVSVDTLGGQERASDPWKLELYVVVSHITWVLGIELRSSARLGSALNY